jgi:DNA polymerase-3 subunit alpha
MVKGVSQRVSDEIVRARDAGGPFTSLLEFCLRIDPRIVTPKIIEHLIKAGAFDSVPPGSRAVHVAMLQKCFNFAKGERERVEDGQMSLGGMLPGIVG